MNGRRFVLACLLAIAAVAVGTTPASAHADLVSSDPANGATLDTAPTEIRLTFSETPDAPLSAIDLLDAGGATMPTGAPTLDGSRTLVAQLTGALADGVYTVSWRAVSADDGHVTTGAFPFGIGTSPSAAAAPPASTTSGPTPSSVVSKSLLYSGFMLLVAIGVVAMWLFDDAPTRRRPLAVWAAVAAAVGAVGFLWAQQRAIGVPMRTYIDSEAGRDPLWIALAAVVALVLAVAGARSNRRSLPWAAAVAAALGLFLRAHGGHAAGAADPLLAELVQWTHMLAGACWAGGLVLLVLLLRERAEDPPVVEARRYSTMAVAAIAIVVASGLARAVSELGGWRGVSSALDTSYGTTLAVKIAIVLVAIALGAWNRFRSIHRLADDARPLRRIVVVELVAVIGVLTLTATLTSFPPPSDLPRIAGAPQAVTLSGSDFATTMDASLTVAPAVPGQNAYRASVTAYGAGQPAAADAVAVELRSITKPELPVATIDLQPVGDAWTGAALAPSVAGTYAVTLAVRAGTHVTEVPLVLTTRSAGSIATTPGPGGEAIATGSFPDGVRVDASSSPGSPTQIHLTAFAPDGTELSIRSGSLVAILGGGAPQRLHVERFSAGHFAATGALPAGMWTFDAVLVSREGTAYQITWEASAG